MSVAPGKEVMLTKNALYAEDAVQTPHEDHFQMNRSGVPGESSNVPRVSHSCTYSTSTAVVGALVMSLVHYRSSRASRTERLRHRLAIAL